jgi:hypothetical protein
MYKKKTCYEYFGNNKFLSKVALEMDNSFHYYTRRNLHLSKKTVEYQEKCTSLACYAKNGGNAFPTFRTKRAELKSV